MKSGQTIQRPLRAFRRVAVSRRQFLRATALTAVSAPLVLRSGLLASAPNSKLAHACVGVGGMGLNDLKSLQSHARVQIVAICDVDAQHLEAAGRLVPGARRYADWRELLETEGDRMDSVNVCVPDHMHFAIAWSAIQRGKHVYCQKPMCHDVAEVRALTEAAARKRVVTQLGTQLAAGVGDRTTVQWLREGVIGKIKHAWLCSNRPGAVEQYRLPGPRPPGGESPPPHLRWDLWLGTAPERPFVREIYHPVKWRAWLDFGTGWSGDIGCHIFDAIWKGLGLERPLSVEARVQESWRNSPARRADTWPQANHITWTFPGNARTEGRTLTVEWFDGDFYPPQEVRALYSVEDYPAESAMLVGTEGALLHTLGRPPVLLPEKKFESYPRPKFEPLDHYHQFVDACLGLTRAASEFAVSGPMTEAVLLGTVAVRVPGMKLVWNARRMKFTNAAEANRLLRRRYREGWRVGGF
ncbi:MAG: Gfo/Idh/MocA family oxidoreductase [Verrucomicrobiae bacterium]|nr:Gfo/Idh/MocA family oxidoreductase [Verrucomicrobiae bacterium]MDW8310881.1 Gfo/Idh/MocA family oxidoreductase [Verrucomicrobiales bacterium]